MSMAIGGCAASARDTGAGYPARESGVCGEDGEVNIQEGYYRRELAQSRTGSTAESGGNAY